MLPARRGLCISSVREVAHEGRDVPATIRAGARFSWSCCPGRRWRHRPPVHRRPNQDVTVGRPAEAEADARVFVPSARRAPPSTHGRFNVFIQILPITVSSSVESKTLLFFPPISAPAPLAHRLSDRCDASGFGARRAPRRPHWRRAESLCATASRSTSSARGGEGNGLPQMSDRASP